MLISSPELSTSDIGDFDVCIIGAGAAGITLACELDRTPLRVLVLEAGGARTDPVPSDHYAGAATEPHPDLAQFRRMGLGGTTSLWGGRCIPLDPIDFERRDYVENSGWPISYDELARHYPRAMAYCDAGAFDFSASGSIPGARATVPGLDGGDRLLADCIERYSLPTDFGRRYHKVLAKSANVTVLLQARCTRLIKRAGDDLIDAVDFADASGQVRRMRSKVFILATGGIETPRLLLNSDPAGGLGNRHDVLGRYYMCHFDNVCARFASNGVRVAFDFEKTRDGVYCRRQLRFSAGLQRTARLRNMVFRLHFPRYSDASHGSSVMSAIYLAKSVIAPEHRAILEHAGRDLEAAPIGPHIRNILTGMPALSRFAAQWLFGIKLAQRRLPYTLVANADGTYPLEFNAEQTPQAANRVMLADATDRHGVRRAAVSWRLCEADVDSAHRGFLLLRDIVNRHACCRVQFDEEQLHELIRRSPPVGGHHIGTARMAGSEKQGIVDADCTVFGLPNLHIASSAVFPTSGYANPTLSIVALAVRLAAHLRRSMQSNGGP